MAFLCVNKTHNAIRPIAGLLQSRVITNQMLKSLEENIREGCAIMDPVMNERKSHGGVHNSPVNIGNNIALSTKIKDPKCSRDPQSAIFLKTLNEQAELCPKKIEEERVKISRLNGLIEGTQRKILMQRSRKGGIEDSQENSKAIAKQVCVCLPQ